eukprot:CAMPEP_0115060136 /NCGR_PEP_ID=MMETSP0227-20121206/7303_1 /TAXON_ID=89957 /ORGANISM="Polarella glacialis, Strain CCMP 1383" /LENGTH=152 /DNA_ID=CAMNT_0002445331 /DNA_START=715 /DNA_END=1174 /DNA_ORIENTATION=-
MTVSAAAAAVRSFLALQRRGLEWQLAHAGRAADWHWWSAHWRSFHLDRVAPRSRLLARHRGTWLDLYRHAAIVLDATDQAAERCPNCSGSLLGVPLLLGLLPLERLEGATQVIRDWLKGVNVPEVCDASQAEVVEEDCQVVPIRLADPSVVI